MKVLAILCLCLGAAVGFSHEPEQQTCEGHADSGMCAAYMPMYYYNTETGTCERFIYGGCQGNGNRYATEERCLENCKGTSQSAVDVCSLEPETGPCRGYFPMYYFDTAAGECKEMIYGGCLGNGNRFATLEDCHDECRPTEIPVRSEVSKDVCSLGADTGPCRGFFRKFHYDAKSGQCKPFIYGGCRGNGNRFNTAEECNTACNVNRQVSKDICSLEPETGLCDALFHKYYFDAKSGECKVFVYGGCGGNDNKFNTVEECNAVCKVARSPLNSCLDEPETGMCRGYFPKYYYDAKSGQCKKFIYGGCGGNGNNYSSEEECLNACH